MSDQHAEDGQGDKHVLAETQVAGFGMANGKVVERLRIEFDRETPAAKLVHARLDYAEPLRDRDPNLETLVEIVANPHDSHRDGEQKLEIGSSYGKDRVIVDYHEHAPRVYIRHEHFDNGEWNEAAAWELHPATGVEEVGGDLVTDGGGSYQCFDAQCDREFDSLDDMVAVDGQGQRSPRHFCEPCAERILRGPPMTDGGQPAEDGRATKHATVKVWSGGRLDSYDDILDEEPDEYQMEVVGEDTYYVPHEDHVVLAEDIEHHGTYAFDVECDGSVELHVETSDHYHDTIVVRERGDSIERGLLFRPDHGKEPFKTEIWGPIRMRVEVSDR